MYGVHPSGRGGHGFWGQRPPHHREARTRSAFRPPRVTVSSQVKPLSAPDPYWIAKAVPLGTYVEESVQRYLFLRRHQLIRLQFLAGTQRLEEPVSNTT